MTNPPKTCGTCRFGSPDTGLAGHTSGMLRCMDPLKWPEKNICIVNPDLPSCRHWDAKEHCEHNFEQVVRGMPAALKKPAAELLYDDEKGMR